MILAGFCSHIHRAGQINKFVAQCLLQMSRHTLRFDSVDLSFKYVSLCALFTATLPEDAAQSGDGGDAVWSVVARLFSVNQGFGLCRISDTFQSASYQTQILPLPRESKNEKPLTLTSLTATPTNVYLFLDRF